MYMYMQVYDIQVHVYNCLVCLTCTVYKSVVKQRHALMFK